MIPRTPLAPADAPPSTTLGTGSAHAKAILLGEHSVVYGSAAIAVPVEILPTHATLLEEVRGEREPRIVSRIYEGPSAAAPAKLAPVRAAWQAASEHFGTDPHGTTLAMESALPIARGLGSSAAVAAAIVRAVADAAGAPPLDPGLEHALIQEAERTAHGTPSGIDARTVVAEGPIRFDHGEVRPVEVAAPVTLVIADTGIPGATSSAVASVRALRESAPRATEAALDRLGALAEGSVTDLATGDRTTLGGRLTEAHELLGSIGVSSPELDTLVAAAHGAGALGAKLTGGGQGGCVIALAPSLPEAGELSRALSRAGAAQVWTTVIGATA
ncbi:mevalonate kinase [Brachybacterium squillarum]|uniref:mevalonate kinase n=1 Tax=Brachybacterium squillarum TaxID=661979 RepID=UPI0002629832|nr:mevalonate kinase [Brachybacterium squillarum]